jgi:hypothetical protein
MEFNMQAKPFKNDKALKVLIEKTPESLTAEDRFVKDIEGEWKVKAVMIASPQGDKPYERNFIFEISDGNGHLPKELSRLSKEEIEFFLFKNYGAVTIDYPVKVENQAQYKKEKRILTGKTISINENIIKQIYNSNKLTKEDETNAVLKILQRPEFSELVASMIFKDKTIEHKLNENMEFEKVATHFQKNLLAVLENNNIPVGLYISSIATFAKESKLKELKLPELYDIEDIIETRFDEAAGKEIPVLSAADKPIILGSKFSSKNNQEQFKKLLECDELRSFLVKNLMNLYPLAKELDRKEAFIRPKATTIQQQKSKTKLERIITKLPKSKTKKDGKEFALQDSNDFPLTVVGRNPETGRSTYGPKDGWKIKMVEETIPTIKRNQSNRHLFEDKVVVPAKKEKLFDWAAARNRDETSDNISGETPKLVKRDRFKNEIEKDGEDKTKPEKVCLDTELAPKKTLQKRDHIARGLNVSIKSDSKEEAHHEIKETGNAEVPQDGTLRARQRIVRHNLPLPALRDGFAAREKSLSSIVDKTDSVKDR